MIWDGVWGRSFVVFFWFILFGNLSKKLLFYGEREERRQYSFESFRYTAAKEMDGFIRMVLQDYMTY